MNACKMRVWSGHARSNEGTEATRVFTAPANKPAGSQPYFDTVSTSNWVSIYIFVSRRLIRMTDYMRNMLAELMSPYEKDRKLDYTDPKVRSPACWDLGGLIYGTGLQELSGEILSKRALHQHKVGFR